MVAGTDSVECVRQDLSRADQSDDCLDRHLAKTSEQLVKAPARRRLTRRREGVLRR